MYICMMYACNYVFIFITTICYITQFMFSKGKDIKLILEGESLKLVEPKSKALLVTQPIAKMRVWGVGKEEQRFVSHSFNSI